MNINWYCKPFNELTAPELYSILQLRNEVFVVEQNCIYLDCDDRDRGSHHFMGWDHDKLVAYTRLLPPGLAYKEMSIGRVVTSPSIRGNKIGRELMTRSIDLVNELYGKSTIKIGAQQYLTVFYESLGFVQSSDTYMEDGIEHIKMTLPIDISL